jgi:hypothetical protein
LQQSNEFAKKGKVGSKDKEEETFQVLVWSKRTDTLRWRTLLFGGIGGLL